MIDYTGNDPAFKAQEELITPESLKGNFYTPDNGAFYARSVELKRVSDGSDFTDVKFKALSSLATGRSDMAAGPVYLIMEFPNGLGENLYLDYQYLDSTNDPKTKELSNVLGNLANLNRTYRHEDVSGEWPDLPLAKHEHQIPKPVVSAIANSLLQLLPKDVASLKETFASLLAQYAKDQMIITGDSPESVVGVINAQFSALSKLLIDLDASLTTNPNGLNTTSLSIVGAINELLSSLTNVEGTINEQLSYNYTLTGDVDLTEHMQAESKMWLVTSPTPITVSGEFLNGAEEAVLSSGDFVFYDSTTEKLGLRNSGNRLTDKQLATDNEIYGPDKNVVSLLGKLWSYYNMSNGVFPSDNVNPDGTIKDYKLLPLLGHLVNDVPLPQSVAHAAINTSTSQAILTDVDAGYWVVKSTDPIFVSGNWRDGTTHKELSSGTYVVYQKTTNELITVDGRLVGDNRTNLIIPTLKTSNKAFDYALNELYVRLQDIPIDAVILGGSLWDSGYSYLSDAPYEDITRTISFKFLTKPLTRTGDINYVANNAGGTIEIFVGESSPDRDMFLNEGSTHWMILGDNGNVVVIDRIDPVLYDAAHWPAEQSPICYLYSSTDVTTELSDKFPIGTRLILGALTDIDGVVAHNMDDIQSQFADFFSSVEGTQGNRNVQSLDLIVPNTNGFYKLSLPDPTALKQGWVVDVEGALIETVWYNDGTPSTSSQILAKGSLISASSDKLSWEHSMVSMKSGKVIAIDITSTQPEMHFGGPKTIVVVCNNEVVADNPTGINPNYRYLSDLTPDSSGLYTLPLPDTNLSSQAWIVDVDNVQVSSTWWNLGTTTVMSTTRVVGELIIPQSDKLSWSITTNGVYVVPPHAVVYYNPDTKIVSLLTPDGSGGAPDTIRVPGVDEPVNVVDLLNQANSSLKLVHGESWTNLVDYITGDVNLTAQTVGSIDKQWIISANKDVADTGRDEVAVRAPFEDGDDRKELPVGTVLYYADGVVTTGDVADYPIGFLREYESGTPGRHAGIKDALVEVDRVVDSLGYNPGDLFHTHRFVHPNKAIPLGSAPVDRNLYSELFSVIGTKYGAGDGSTTFGIPAKRSSILKEKIDLPVGTGDFTKNRPNTDFSQSPWLIGWSMSPTKGILAYKGGFIVLNDVFIEGMDGSDVFLTYYSEQGHQVASKTANTPINSNYDLPIILPVLGESLVVISDGNRYGYSDLTDDSIEHVRYFPDINDTLVGFDRIAIDYDWTEGVTYALKSQSANPTDANLRLERYHYIKDDTLTTNLEYVFTAKKVTIAAPCWYNWQNAGGTIEFEVEASTPYKGLEGQEYTHWLIVGDNGQAMVLRRFEPPQIDYAWLPIDTNGTTCYLYSCLDFSWIFNSLFPVGTTVMIGAVKDTLQLVNANESQVVQELIAKYPTEISPLTEDSTLAMELKIEEMISVSHHWNIVRPSATEVHDVTNATNTNFLFVGESDGLFRVDTSGGADNTTYTKIALSYGGFPVSNIRGVSYNQHLDVLYVVDGTVNGLIYLLRDPLTVTDAVLELYMQDTTGLTIDKVCYREGFVSYAGRDGPSTGILSALVTEDRKLNLSRSFRQSIETEHPVIGYDQGYGVGESLIFTQSVSGEVFVSLWRGYQNISTISLGVKAAFNSTADGAMGAYVSLYKKWYFLLRIGSETIVSFLNPDGTKSSWELTSNHTADTIWSISCAPGSDIIGCNLFNPTGFTIPQIYILYPTNDPLDGGTTATAWLGRVPYQGMCVQGNGDDIHYVIDTRERAVGEYKEARDILEISGAKTLFSARQKIIARLPTTETPIKLSYHYGQDLLYILTDTGKVYCYDVVDRTFAELSDNIFEHNEPGKLFSLSSGGEYGYLAYSNLGDGGESEGVHFYDLDAQPTQYIKT